MSLAANLADIANKVRTVPALSANSGLALGGRGADPGLARVPLPAAWVLFHGDADDDEAASRPHARFIPSSQSLLLTVSLMIYVPYTSEADLLTVQLPLLRAVRGAIHATDAPSGHRWCYWGQTLRLVQPDKLGYEQRYFLTSPE